MRPRPRAFLAAAITCLAVAAAPIGVASAFPAFHLRLTRSEPAKDATVAAPKVIRLWFSESPTLAVTSVKLAGPGGTEVVLGKPSHAGDASQPIEAAVPGALAAGRYTVTYKTASKDMHPVSGDFAFTVR